ncbi:MAG: nitroreductase family protein [Deferrisomatales bacterium]
MELYEAVRGRRSIRRYKPDPVPPEVLDRLLEAAQWAPSWAHTQCCEVVIVSKPEQKEALQQALPPSNPAFKAMGQAPVAVAFCAQTGRAGFYKGKAATSRGDWMMFDVALAMENFMLAAYAEGLGTVCVGLFDEKKAAEVLKAPPGVEVIALTPLGYPDAEAKTPPRKDRTEFARWESY